MKVNRVNIDYRQSDFLLCLYVCMLEVVRVGGSCECEQKMAAVHHSVTSASDGGNVRFCRHFAAGC